MPIREIARSSWASESGGAPISWSGGNILSLLAPGLGYSYPWDDAALDQAGIYPFTDLPEALEIDVKAEAQEALRESLARRSEPYRRPRDGLASPRSPEGQALAAALDGALDDGNIGRLTSGQWE